MRAILRDIRKADKDFKMFEEGDRVAVGVSGGKDSMILLKTLHMYSNYAGKKFKVIGIHINLGFPGMDFSEVIEYCEKEGIEFHDEDSHVYQILDAHRKNGVIQCSLCSKLKKGTVIEAAKKYGCSKVAFGHHSNDAVETLLMNAIYGGRLSTFKPKMYLTRQEITFVRPLIYTYEEDIKKIREYGEIPFVVSTCPNDGYTKRQEMKELLENLYKEYPMAKKNFVYMLKNKKQLDLWEIEEEDD